ncbi:RloB family protein [Sinosporangium album]|uniref:RloB family protein n=1 Tax=Sinosporangium album TaxID=504805 RepID=UPI001C40AA7A|nr:RloB family protein [Sinosporangium album]
MSRQGSRRGGDLRRRRNTRSEKSRILIVAEGEKTEPQYFKGLARLLRATGVDVYKLDVERIGRDPLRVVERASFLYRKAHPGERYDHVWCVVDVDRHQLLEAALREANRLSISMAISNPCFDLWILWHYADHRSYVDQEALRRKLKSFGISDKNLPVGFPYGDYKVAIRRAESCGFPGRDGLRVPDNPFSSVSDLVKLVASGN